MLDRGALPKVKLVTFDLGSTWAVAYACYPEAPVVKHKTLTGNREAKLLQFLLDLQELFTELSARDLLPDTMIYERPFARGQAATRMLWGMAGVLEAVATSFGMGCLDIPPASIKEWTAGKGDATKAEMIDAAQTLGYVGSNEHEADAYALLCYAEHKVFKPKEK